MFEENTPSNSIDSHKMENLNTATGGVEEGLTSRPRTTILVDEGGLVLVEVLEEPVLASLFSEDLIATTQQLAE
ncbi:hypothetical protein M8J76_014223 [Diaphorina citri]|nr:hypothetical protein M8J76_014223 [Diaphorina citri]